MSENMTAFIYVETDHNGISHIELLPQSDQLYMAVNCHQIITIIAHRHSSSSPCISQPFARSRHQQTPFGFVEFAGRDKGCVRRWQPRPARVHSRVHTQRKEYASVASDYRDRVLNSDVELHTATNVIVLHTLLQELIVEDAGSRPVIIS